MIPVQRLNAIRSPHSRRRDRVFFPSRGGEKTDKSEQVLKCEAAVTKKSSDDALFPLSFAHEDDDCSSSLTSTFSPSSLQQLIQNRWPPHAGSGTRNTPCRSAPREEAESPSLEIEKEIEKGVALFSLLLQPRAGAFVFLPRFPVLLCPDLLKGRFPHRTSCTHASRAFPPPPHYLI